MSDTGKRAGALERALRERIVLLDGAMGTMIQDLGLAEEDFRGARFAGHDAELRGNNDLLNLTQAEAIGAIHRAFLAAFEARSDRLCELLGEQELSDRLALRRAKVEGIREGAIRREVFLAAPAARD